MKTGIKVLLIIAVVVIVIIAAAIIVFNRLEQKSSEAYKQLLAEGVPYIDFSEVADGEYSGRYYVFPVGVELEVVVVNGKINDIELLKHVNGQGGPAETILEDIIEGQTLQVDAVSGATFSSMVILKAVENALTEE